MDHIFKLIIIIILSACIALNVHYQNYALAVFNFCLLFFAWNEK